MTIARALVNDPAMVWADEPTGDLDKKTADEVVALMRQLNKENDQTFVIVTHDPEVGAKCDRIIHMRDGQVVSTNGHVEQHRPRDQRDGVSALKVRSILFMLISAIVLMLPFFLCHCLCA